MKAALLLETSVVRDYLEEHCVEEKRKIPLLPIIIQSVSSHSTEWAIAFHFYKPSPTK